MELLLSQCWILPEAISKTKWKFTVANGSIESDGKVFIADEYTFARTDQVMNPNTCIYEITWLVSETGGSKSVLGSCNKMFDTKKQDWYGFDNYIGWKDP